MIVDFDGRVLAQAEAGPGERIVVGPIDLAALRYERERRRGHHTLNHLRREGYGGGHGTRIGQLETRPPHPPER